MAGVGQLEKRDVVAACEESALTFSGACRPQRVVQTVYANRDEIIRLARNPKKLKAYPTKYSAKGPTINLSFKVAKSSVQTKVVTIDEIDSFAQSS